MIKILLHIWTLPIFIGGHIFRIILAKNITRTGKTGYATVYYCRNFKEFGVSFGLLIFVSDDARGDALIKHEYGHSIQCFILGALYFFLSVYGFFHFLRFNSLAEKAKTDDEKKAIWRKYHSEWPDGWANRISGFREF